MSENITIKNAIPELLEAVCEHPNCPEWLKFDIWDAFANHNHEASFKAAHWRAVLDCNPDDKDERIPGQCQYPGCSEPIDVLRYCMTHAEELMIRARQRQETIEGGVQ